MGWETRRVTHITEYRTHTDGHSLIICLAQFTQPYRGTTQRLDLRIDYPLFQPHNFTLDNYVVLGIFG